MKYIVHRTFQGIAVSGDSVTLPVGSEFESIGFFIAHNNSAICRLGSLAANQHFAPNDDGYGLERGVITFAIAYDYKFSDEDITLILNDYPQFLKDSDALLFNQDFFNADIVTLRTMAAKLDISYDIPVIPENMNIAITPQVVNTTVKIDNISSISNHISKNTSDTAIIDSLQVVSDTLDSIITGGV